jgi:hypothetical protein
MAAFKILTTAEMARAFDVSNAQVSVWKSRGNLHPNSEGNFDLEFPLNKLHIEKIVAKGKKTFDLGRLYKVKKAPEVVVESEKVAPTTPIPEQKVKKEKPTTSKEFTTLQNANLKKVQLSNKNLEKQIELNELKIQKQKGALIPADAAKSLLLFTVENFHSTYIQGVESLLNVFAQRFGASITDHGELRTDLIELINAQKTEGINNTIDGIESISEEYSEVRSRGEKK